MITFDLFLTFTILSCIFIFLGYYTKPQITVLAILGFATLFFMGMLLQFGGVQQKVGSVDSYSYSNSTVSAISTAYSYDVIDDSTSVWVGRWLAIVSALGLALVFTSNKQTDGDD